MSGKALEGKAETKRIPNHSEWVRISDEVKYKLRYTSSIGTAFTNTMHRTVVLTGKDLTYGDVDFIIPETNYENLGMTEDKIAKVLESKAWATNGNVSSFEFKDHQIDFIRVPDGTSSLNANLLGHGGAGHLLRFIGRPYGFQIGLGGMIYRLEDQGEFVDNITVSLDNGSIMNTLDMSRYTGSSGSFHYGFRTLDDAYRFITTSVYFTLSAFYLDEALNYIGKPHRLEYAPFAGFIEYLKREAPLRQGAAQWPVYPTAAQRKSMEKRFEIFPEFKKNCSTAIEAFAKTRILRNKFSGDVVMAATGLTPGNELGVFMEAYKDSFDSRGKFQFFIMSSSIQTIVESLQAAYVKHQEGRLATIKAKLRTKSAKEVVDHQVETLKNNLVQNLDTYLEQVQQVPFVTGTGTVVTYQTGQLPITVTTPTQVITFTNAT